MTTDDQTFATLPIAENDDFSSPDSPLQETSSGGGGGGGAGKKTRRKPKAKFQRISKARQLANARERRRAQRIHDGFLGLSKCVPQAPDEEGRLSRMEVLSRAINYIDYLRSIVESTNDVAGSLPQQQQQQQQPELPPLQPQKAWTDCEALPPASTLVSSTTRNEAVQPSLPALNLTQIDFDVDEDLSDIASTVETGEDHSFDNIDSVLSSLAESPVAASHASSPVSQPQPTPQAQAPQSGPASYLAIRLLNGSANSRLHTPVQSPSSVESDSQPLSSFRGLSMHALSPQGTAPSRRVGGAVTAHEKPQWYVPQSPLTAPPDNKRPHFSNLLPSRFDSTNDYDFYSAVEDVFQSTYKFVTPPPPPSFLPNSPSLVSGGLLGM